VINVACLEPTNGPENREEKIVGKGRKNRCISWWKREAVISLTVKSTT
jgi:hypothetical protein